MRLHTKSCCIYKCVLSTFFLQILCVEGGEFEPFPTCLSLPAKAGPHAVILLGTPHSVGQLRITGKSHSITTKTGVVVVAAPLVLREIRIFKTTPLLKHASSPRVSRSSVVSAPNRYLGGHRFDYCRGLIFRLCPMLVTNGLFIFINTRQTDKQTDRCTNRQG